MIAPTSHVRVTLYEENLAPSIDAEFRFRLLNLLLTNGVSVHVVRGGPPIAEMDHADLDLIVGRFATVVPSQMDRRVKDLTGETPESIWDWIRASAFGEEPAATRRWKPWFPVIDFKRCTNCMQCLSFCLFDVYGATPDGRIQVQNESNCKTDCPACSRVCPEVAIMFPKYKAGPINGEEINSEDVRREAMKVDISALLGGDIYSLLRDRSARAKSRFSKERDDERALRERQRCLDQIKSSGMGLEVPAEVLASLPSLGEIQQKAQQARDRATTALAAREAARTNPANSTIEPVESAGEGGPCP